MRREEYVQHVLQRHLIGVELDLYNLSVPGQPSADLAVSRIGRHPAGIAGHQADDPGELLEDGLDTPETTAAKDYLLHVTSLPVLART